MVDWIVSVASACSQVDAAQFCPSIVLRAEIVDINFT